MNRFAYSSSLRDVNALSEFKVSIRFLDTGEFFFSGTDEDGHALGGLSLSYVLFSRFPDNIYGTMSKFNHLYGEPGVFLSPREALKYFQGAYFNSMIPIVWPDEFNRIRAMAISLQAVLETGKFAPDFQDWKTGKMGWKILSNEVNVHKFTAPAQPDNALPKSAMLDVGFAAKWLNSILNQLISENPNVRDAFAAVLNRSLMLQLDTSERKTAKGSSSVVNVASDHAKTLGEALDEQEWLAEIGWMEHPVPFRVCLELKEPDMVSLPRATMSPGVSASDLSDADAVDAVDTLDTVSLGSKWGLNVVLQDKEDASRLFYYHHQIDEDRPTIAGMESLIGETPPADWLDHKDWLDNKIAAMVKLVPWLSPPAGECGGYQTAGLPEVRPTAVESEVHSTARASEAEDNLNESDFLVCLRQWLTTEEAWLFLTEAGLTLAEAGFTVFLPAWWEKVKQAKSRIKIRVASSVASQAQPLFGIDQTIDFDWQIAVGDIDLSEAEYHRLVAAKTRLVRLRGQWVQVSPEFLAAAKRALQQIEKKHGLTFRDVLEMVLLGVPKGSKDEQPSQLPGNEKMDEQKEHGADSPDQGTKAEVHGEGGPEQVDGFGQAGDAEHTTVPIDIELNTYLAEFIARLQQTDTDLLSTPSGFVGELRPYQVRGFSWLCFLYQFGLGAVLADDMGLGKTVQYIAYLLQIQTLRSGTKAEVAISLERDTKLDGADGPALLICPTSVLGNWQKELKRFAPGLQTYVHYGTLRRHGEAFQTVTAKADLVLTTYALAQLDQSDLQSVIWDSVCLDEAQNIKNAHGKQSVAIRKLSARHRIAMTGTPMENRLTELWSIFDFINPGYLGGLTAFTRRFVTPIEKTQDTALLARLRRLVQPFMLRRLKTDPAIELDLPEKTESKVYVSLTAEQAALYESLLADLLARIETADPMERRGLILSTLTRLKQVCNHPALALKDDAINPVRTEKARSAKLERFAEMVQELRAEGDKCLVFTQFVETGKMLVDVLQTELGEEVLFLHGGTSKKQRDGMIESFHLNDAPYGVFVLSLKAGGVGLNLTAANHVFHFDRWWNPAVENQATDRAYRIGQHQHVNVYKFVALGTVEERIDELISRKQVQSEEILGAGEQWITELSTDELRDLFALRREWVN